MSFLVPRNGGFSFLVPRVASIMAGQPSKNNPAEKALDTLRCVYKNIVRICERTKRGGRVVPLFDTSNGQCEIGAAMARLCEAFDAEYWREKDARGEFPTEFFHAVADGGWLGITMPSEYGGSGLGVTEAAIMMKTIAASGAGFSGASAIHGYLFAPKPIAIYGSHEQKQKMLPPLISGQHIAAFGVTEPDSGLNTAAIKTTAKRTANGYVINGSKVWSTLAQRAHKYLILARTTPIEQVAKPTDGLSIFFVDFDRDYLKVNPISKMGRSAIDSNIVFIENYEVSEDTRIGEEGKGFRYLLDGLNPERILLASEAVGLGLAAIRRAANYANERVVFGRLIGKNQAIQHPLARAYMELHAAELVTMNAARLYDAGIPCGIQANSAKYLAAEAGFRACETAIMTHGGFGYAREYDVERYFREIMIPRIAPVSREMILCYVAENALNLPRSY